MDPIDKAALIEERLALLYRQLQICHLCPRRCEVNRTAGETGYCGGGLEAVVYTAFLHQGEEPGISGKQGSGTIFFSGCNLRCVYCQNHRFSHTLEGTKVSPDDLARIMVRLQERGAENINLVTATHFLPWVLDGLARAFRNGLALPIVYNTSGYETVETVKVLGDVVDIYLADMRYVTPSLAERYSKAPDYPAVNKLALRKMYEQKSVVWQGRLLKEGLVVRHLVLPGYAEETIKALAWMSENTPQALVSLMFQYQPYFEAGQYPEINRRVNEDEYERVMDFLDELDLEGWTQDLVPEADLAGVHFKPTLEGLI
ncbi:MAG: radical SAM protein [Dehalococcoidia bacterium]|nr:radical SAM protein [Dehalococcoidia bacterium]